MHFIFRTSHAIISSPFQSHHTTELAQPLPLPKAISHPRLNLLKQLLQLLHIRLLLRPPNTESLLAIRFRNHMEMHMINLLMRNPSIILQNIIILRPSRLNQFLNDGQDFGECVVRDVG